MAKAKKPTVVVPFITAKEGDGRLQAQIIGRALARAGFGNLTYATRVRRKWDARLTTLLRDFELANGIHHGTPTKAYTRETHRKLARWYDAYNLRLIGQLHAQTREDRLRAAVVAKLQYLYNRRSLMRYTQQRPYDRRNQPTGLDCSSTKAWADEKAGAPKSGSPWGFGNTYTQLDHYRRLGRVIVKGRAPYAKAAKPGDPVYYGAPSHVSIYLGGNRCASFGSFPMKILDVDYRDDRSAVCSLL